MTKGFLVSVNVITFFDIMVYVEISQVLAFYNAFVHHSKSEIYKDFEQTNPDWEEQDELKEYKQLADWYNKLMKLSEAYESIKKYDQIVRQDIKDRIVS